MSDPVLSIIVAVARNGVIGQGGEMPWRLSTDLKRFRALTMGKPVVMGRKTHQAIGKPLAGRTNIVVTRDRGFAGEDVVVAASLDQALGMARDRARSAGQDEFFVIGGGEIYAGALPEAGRLHVTHVEASPQGDTHFPPIDPREWDLVEEVAIPAADTDSAPTRYAVYRRNDRDRSRSRAKSTHAG